MWMPGLRKAGLICDPRIWLCGKSALRRWREAGRIFAGAGQRLLLSKGISMTTFALARSWAGSLITSKMDTGLSMGIGLSEVRANHPTPRAAARVNTSHLRTSHKKCRGERIKQVDKIEKLLLRLKGLRWRQLTLFGFVLVVDLLDLP